MPQKYWGLTVIGCLWVFACAGLTYFAGASVFVSLRPDLTKEVPGPPIDFRLAALVCLCLAVWAAMMANGFFRRKYWAWDGTVVITGFFVVGGFLAPSFGKSAGQVNLVFSALSGLLMAAPVALCLRYLVRQRIQAEFKPEPQAKVAAIALPVRLVAFLILIGGVGELGQVMVLDEFPLFGLKLTGAVGRAYMLAGSAVSLYCGIGLYRANDLARRVAIGYLLFGAIASLYWPFEQSASQASSLAVVAGSAAAVCAFSVPMIWVLVTRRQGFTSS